MKRRGNRTRGRKISRRSRDTLSIFFGISGSKRKYPTAHWANPNLAKMKTENKDFYLHG